MDGVGVRMRMRRPRHLHLSFFSAVGKITRSSLRCERDSTPRDRMNGDAAKSGLSIGNEGGEPAFPHPACATNGRLNKCVLESETGPMCPSRIESHWTSTFRFVILSYSDSGAGRNLKVGGGARVRRETPEKYFLAPPLFALQVQLVVLVSAFVIVGTVWSVSYLLFLLLTLLPCPSVCKSGGTCPPCPTEFC